MEERSNGLIDFAARNPIGFAIGALAVGFLIGLVVPVTPIESERIGPFAEGLREQARESGAELLEHGRAVIDETVQAAVESGRSHAVEAVKGVMTGDASAPAQHSNQVLQETAQAAISALRSHGQEVAAHAVEGFKEKTSTEKTSTEKTSTDR